jgi:hypothetical protein
VSAALLPFVRGGLEAVRPISAAVGEPQRFRALMGRLGYDLAIDSDTLERLAWAEPLLDLVEQAEELARDLRGPSDDGAEQVLGLIGLVQSIIELIEGLDDASSIVEGGSAPAELGDPDFWADVAGALPDLALTTWLARSQPALHSLLRLTGAVEDRPVGGNGSRRAHTREAFDWSRLGSAVVDPGGAVAERVGWGTGGFDHELLLGDLARGLRRMGIKARRPPMDERFVGGSNGALITDGHAERWSVRGLTVPFLSGLGGWGEGYIDLGLLVYPAPRQPGGAIDGLYLTVLADTGYEAVAGLGGDWQLTIGGDLSATGAVGVRVHPDEAEFVGSQPDALVELAIEGEPATPWRLLGTTPGPRIEADSARFAVALQPVPEPELRLSAALEGLRVVIEPGEADALMRTLMGENSATVEIDGSVAWSSRSGVTLGGQVGLAVRIPIEKDLGIIHLDRIDLAVAPSGDGAALEAGVTGSALIGPVTLHATNVGLRLLLEPQEDRTSGVFGDLGVGFGLKPPDGVGFELDLDAGGGSGFLMLDEEIGRYAGGLNLDFVAIGLSGVGIVDTQLPGDPDGWALFLSLSLTFPSVPLGFGFFLSGVGGLVCLNRTMDVEALAGGLSSGAVDAILFPEEPEKDAALIVSQLDSWFPLAEGSLVFGVAGRITWGTPKTLVTADVGVVLSFPELDFAVMGSVSIELPEETDALLELNMDVIGTIDLSEGTVMVVAALHDSSLLKTLQLSGGMAMYASFGAHPYFLLSVGGYHPDFQPPAELPAAVTELDRMRVELELSENAWFALEAYFAITSNTLQFGSEATLELSDKFLGVTYTARGSVGFDVLLVFSPFSFSAGIHAGVAITAGSGDKELLAVDLSARLEGPEPWHATGRASFDFFGLNASIEIEIGGTAGVEAQPPVDLLTEVETALRDPAAWHGTSPTGADTGAVLLTAEEPPAAGQVWVRPDAELEVVQTVAPLERQLDRYGIYAIDGDSLLTITEAGLGGEVADHEPVLDWFAPAQYDDYKTNAERLAAPSYEEMTGGLRFGTEGVSLSPDSHNRSVTPDYEVKILDEDKTREQPLGQLAAPLDRVTAPLTLDTTRRGLPGRNATSTHFTIEQPSWTIANATTGTAITTTGTYRDTLNTLHTTTATDPTTRATQRLAPTHTVLETT